MADGRDGEQLRGRLSWSILQSTLDDSFAFDLNGDLIPAGGIRREFVEDRELPHVWHEVDLADCPKFRGNNELGVRLLKWTSDRPHSDERNALYEDAPYLEEVIVAVEAH